MGSILGPKIEEKSIKKLGRTTITEKRGKKRPKEVDEHAGGRKFGPRGEGKGEGAPLPLGFTGINLGIKGSKRPDPLYEGPADYLLLTTYY